MVKSNLSIHPRAWPNDVNPGREKSNTATVRNPKRKGKLDKHQAKLAQRRLSHSATLKMLPSNAAMAYKTPGSMNQKS